MTNPFRNRDQEREQERGRWTEQGQTGAYYGDAARDQSQDRNRDGSYERNSPHAQGQGGYAQPYGQREREPTWNRTDYGQGRSDPQSTRYGSEMNQGWNAGRSEPQWGRERDYDAPRSQGSYYGQAAPYRSSYDQGRDAPTWQRGHASPSTQAAYRGDHHDFEPDYLHWREQQMSRFDRDYTDWRNEKRQKFSSDFEGWRSSRGPGVQAENSVVGDVADGGGGSQAHAKELHGDKPAKH